MAKTGFLKGSDKIPFLPITRAELVKDSGGKCAFQSDAFLATSENNGILSSVDKDKLDKMVGIHFINEDEGESIPESHFNISFASIDDGRVEGSDAFYITFPYGDGTQYGAQIAIDDCSDPTILVRGKSWESEGEWGGWHRVLLENDSVKNPNALTINRYGVEVTKYDGSVAKTVDLAPIALSGTTRITDAKIRDLEKLPNKYNLAVGYWAGQTTDDTCNFNTRYGTTLDLSYSTWYQRLAFDTSAIKGKHRIEYFSGINKTELDKIGDLAYLSDIPSHWANVPLASEAKFDTEPTFKSVTASEYNVKINDSERIKIHYPVNTKESYLTITGSKDIIKANESKIVPGNENITLGSADDAWNGVYAKNLVLSSIDATSLICTDKDKKLTKYTESCGENYKPIYLEGGKFKTMTNLGSNITGLYLDKDGILTPMDYSLKANVESGALIYISQLAVYSGGTFYPLKAGLGGTTRGIYIQNTGVPAYMTYELKATVQAAAASGRLAYYSTTTNLRSFDSTVGTTHKPIYIDGGAPTAIKMDAKTNSTLYVVGWKNKDTDTDDTDGLYTGTQGTSSGVRILGGNKVYASGGFWESSDESLKDFKEDVQVDLNALSRIPKKYFTWKADESKEAQLGTSAQAVQKLYPELVKEDSEGTLHVAYERLSVVALAAIDELHKQIEDLKAENESFKARLEKLERLLYEK
jgi:hypothetical protein